MITAITAELIRLLKIVALFLILIACQKAQAVVSNLEAPNFVPEVEVLFPGGAYVSEDNNITIFGNCISGATVAMEGDATKATLCVSNLFSFVVKKRHDGSYVFHIWQILDGDESASVHVNWVKHSEY
jgi:hypothetical protein